MTWNDFNKEEKLNFNGQLETNIECPQCGKSLIFDSNIVLTSYPAQYSYWCKCGWHGTSYFKWSPLTEKLEYYSSSNDGYNWTRHPTSSDIVDKVNEMISVLNGLR